MKFRLVFENTNDEVEFESCQDQVVTWFVDWLNSQRLNLLRPRAGVAYWQTSLRQFDESLRWYNNVSGLSEYVNNNLAVCDRLEDYLDQSLLNRYHANWVKIQKTQIDLSELRKQISPSTTTRSICELYPDHMKHVFLSDIIEKLGLMPDFLKINTYLHSIEESADRSMICISSTMGAKNIFVDNPFPKSMLTAKNAHLRITGSHLGRTLYNKYINRDDHLEADDENTFDDISPKVDIRLGRNVDRTMPQDYIDWCKSNGVEPLGDRLNLGDIVDLEQNLLYYRKLFYRNLTQGNGFSLVLH